MLCIIIIIIIFWAHLSDDGGKNKDADHKVDIHEEDLEGGQRNREVADGNEGLGCSEQASHIARGQARKLKES